MSRVIDLELDLPPTSEDEIVGVLRVLMQHRGEQGLANYLNIFGPRRARALGLTLPDVERMWDELSPQEFEAALRERARGLTTSLSEFIDELDEAGVEWGLIEAGSNDKTAEIVSQFPRRFIGQATVNPHDGVKAVRELERGCQGTWSQVLLRLPLQVRDSTERQEVLPSVCQSGRPGHPRVRLLHHELPHRLSHGSGTSDLP